MLRRRSSTGSMPMRRAAMSSSTSRASVSNCPRPSVGGAAGGVREHRRRRPRRSPGSGTGPGTACRPPPRCRPATASGRRRRPARGRSAAASSVPSSANAIAASAVLVAGLARRHEVLAAVLDPLQRGRHLAGRQHQAHVLAERHDLLTEAAARVAHDHPDAVLRQPEQPGAERPHLVRRLGRRPDRELARPTTRRPARGSRSARRRRPAGRSSR